MRYYSMKFTRPNGQPYEFPSLAGAGLPPGVISSLLPDGQTTNPAALNIEVDLPEYIGLVGNTNGYVRIWGLPLSEISQGFDLNGKNVEVRLGMSKGLPLATAAVGQRGVVLAGKIQQAFGNWVGTDMTLDFNVGGNPDATNFQLVWAQGTSLADAIKQTLSVAMPGITVDTTRINPQRVAPADLPGTYESFTQFAQCIALVTQDANGDGAVAMATNGNVITCFETTAENLKQVTNNQTDVTVQFQDMLGQPTWYKPFQVTAKLVMRGDIRPGMRVQFPKDAPTLVTAGAMPSFGGAPGAVGSPGRKQAFDGVFMINQVQHWGNYRQPDALAWNTTVWGFLANVDNASGGG